MINRWTKFLTATVATASLLLLTSCGSSSTSATKYPKVVSTNALTGLPGINGPVLFVKIDDTRQAHPQIGLDSADVIYIEQVEGGLTRLAAIFSNTLPAKIGPIRSARISDIDLMANYGRVGMAYSGAQSKFLPVLRAPTDMVVDPKALLNKSINVEHRSIVTAKSVGWKFGPLPVGGQVIKSVELKWPAARYKAVWSSGTQKWQMYYNGALDVAADGAQLGSPTLLIQEVSITPSTYHDKLGSYTPFSNTIGSGSGFLLRDGQEIPVFWNRVNATEPTTWTLKDGSPAYLPVGQVWIALTDQQPVFVLPALSTPTPSASK